MNGFFLEGGLSIPIYEATQNDTKFILKEIYPKIDKVLSTSSGTSKFKSLVGSYIDRNSDKLYTSGPQYQVLFTHQDKNDFFKLFELTPEEIQETAKKVTDNISTDSNWFLIRDNPIFIVFISTIRYYSLQNNAPMLQMAIAAFSISMYPSIYKKYWDYEPNPAIMQYTIDNLSLKSTIKKEKHLFGIIMARGNQAYSFHKQNLQKGYDLNYINFLIRLRNDYNSFMKKLTSAFHENHKKGLGAYTTVDVYDDNAVVDVENNTNKIYSIAEKVSNNFITNGVDLKLAKAAADACNVHFMDIRGYLQSTITVEYRESMKNFIEAIIFLFVYEANRPIHEINTKSFLEFTLILYKKANSKNINIVRIKDILDKWSDSLGITKMYTSKTTINGYKRGIYLYFIFIIQKYN